MVYLRTLLRTLLPICLLLLTLVPTLSKVGLYLCFEWQRDALTEARCKNAGRPELMCYASCFLERQLTVAKNSELKQVSLVDGASLSALVARFPAISSLPAPSSTTDRRLRPYDQYYSSPFAALVFHPPRRRV